VVTVEGFHMSEERDETGLVRSACWWLCDAKDSYSCAILCEGWGGVVEWRDEERKASEWLMRASPTLLTRIVTFGVR